ncbi:hypothetical protein F9C07_11066 [Aspergillus flavus]|uniref:Uncharacterized protein n=2 Tax=Aspergillus flavus TaxID=5059 RepID=B8NRT3_ASPFN|nr:uncharacterized protein G4B84_000350 [Aspergillus flavus NRRL3357]KAB8242920.1 hypothetical protein BDV35DRAFT_14719 [Aspergillus flavus]KJJ34537.1 hypothetical protein AFLA70_606g000600 [Aspergillus flavus AF70]GMF79465.1 unnamed protein product [Aspergillus oryzae]KAF7630330.1 hypothetical protein AFLA_010956 [Aspergillus flavus NRRL3357]KAJ1711827.1 tRNA-splicing endonuclease subunit Sen15 [Aspergillus flavus]
MASTQSTPIATPELSALTNLISTSASSDPLSASTVQILHNLQHQHLWTSLQVHDLKDSNLRASPLGAGLATTPSEEQTVPRYLISGIPPHRVYTHPDEQLYLLERGLREEDIELERIFVLPTVKNQPWSLRKMASVFDSLPDEADIQAEESSMNDSEETNDGAGGEKGVKLVEYYEYRKKARLTKEWGGKRLLLAMVDRGMGGDGTVVYYVVQEGAVKPRQN